MTTTINAALFAQIDQRFERVDGALKLHRWILATNTGLLIAILLKLLL